MTHNSLNDLVRAEFCMRRERNPSYTLRAFAKQLNISSGALSEIMQGKRRVGARISSRLSDQIGSFDSSSRGVADQQLKTLNDDALHLIKEWYHYALQDLLRTKGCKRTPPSLAVRLGISSAEVLEALKRMQRLGLVRHVGEKWYATKVSVTTSVDLPSSVIKSGHLQDLRNATRALDESGVLERDFSAITLCFAPERLAEAKQRIKEFRRSFWKEFDQTGGTEVYQLGLYLFPLTKCSTGGNS